jgi:hypothetical protein
MVKMAKRARWQNGQDLKMAKTSEDMGKHLSEIRGIALSGSDGGEQADKRTPQI